jgi:hypothetical protein
MKNVLEGVLHIHNVMYVSYVQHIKMNTYLTYALVGLGIVRNAKSTMKKMRRYTNIILGPDLDGLPSVIAVAATGVCSTNCKYKYR